MREHLPARDSEEREFSSANAEEYLHADASHDVDGFVSTFQQAIFIQREFTDLVFLVLRIVS